jgi:hypothetical protein
MGKKQGVIVAFGLGSGAYAEAGRAHNEKGLENQT